MLLIGCPDLQPQHGYLFQSLMLPQITYVKASQGFVWNHEIFLPRESDDGRGGVGECWGRQEGVVEIRLSEEDRFLPV